jgi:hypothetical protein
VYDLSINEFCRRFKTSNMTNINPVLVDIITIAVILACVIMMLIKTSKEENNIVEIVE